KGVVHTPDSASPVENVVTLIAAVGGRNDEIWALSLDDRKLTPVIRQPPAVGYHVFSPDGHWLAYRSVGTVIQTNPPQIYVHPFRATGSKYKIPQTGRNGFPLWSPDGKQIFYLSRESAKELRINAVDVRTQPSVEFGKSVSLPIEIPTPSSGFQGYPF